MSSENDVFRLDTDGFQVSTIDHVDGIVPKLITEYKESTNLINYITVLMKQSGELESVFKSIIDDRWIESAFGFSLDVIGIILDQPRVVIDASVVSFFGFVGAPNAQSFGSLRDPSIGGRFRSLGEASTGNRILTDTEYRLFLKAKAISNSTGTSVSELQQVLCALLGDVAVQITQGSVGISYDVLINRPLTVNESVILNNTSIIPKTNGAVVTYSGVEAAAGVQRMTSSDQVINTTTPTSITGLTMSVAPGRYDIVGYLNVESDGVNPIFFDASISSSGASAEIYLEFPQVQTPEGSSDLIELGSQAAYRPDSTEVRRLYVSGEVHVPNGGGISLLARTVGGGVHTIKSGSFLRYIPVPTVGGFRRWQLSFAGNGSELSIANIHFAAEINGLDISTPDDSRPFDSLTGTSPDLAFDSPYSPETYWSSNSASSNISIGTLFDHNRNIVQYRITAPAAGALPPSEFALEASNISSSSIIIEDRTELVWQPGETKTFTVGGGVASDYNPVPVDSHLLSYSDTGTPSNSDMFMISTAPTYTRDNLFDPIPNSTAGTSQIAVSPDNTKLLVVNGLFDITTSPWTLLETISTGPSTGNLASKVNSFSRDSSRFIIIKPSGASIRSVNDVNTEISEITGLESTVSMFRYSRFEDLLAVVTDSSGRLRVYDVSVDPPVLLQDLTSSLDLGDPIPGEIAGVDFQDGYMAVVTTVEHLAVFDTTTWTKQAVPTLSSDEPLTNCQFSPDGSLLATCQSDYGSGAVKLFDSTSIPYVRIALSGVIFPYPIGWVSIDQSNSLIATSADGPNNSLTLYSRSGGILTVLEEISTSGRSKGNLFFNPATPAVNTLTDTFFDDQYWESSGSANGTWRSLFMHWNSGSFPITARIRITPITSGANLGWQVDYRPDTLFVGLYFSPSSSAEAFFTLKDEFGNVIASVDIPTTDTQFASTYELPIEYTADGDIAEIEFFHNSPDGANLQLRDVRFVRGEYPQ